MPETLFHETLPAEERARLNEIANDLRGLAVKTAACVWDMGDRLIKARKLLRGRHGEDEAFRSWLARELPELHLRMAYRYIDVAERFARDNLSRSRIALSALYLLAADSTPDEAVDEAIARAGAGETITHARAKEIKRSVQETVTRALDGLPPEKAGKLREILERAAKDKAEQKVAEAARPLLGLGNRPLTVQEAVGLLRVARKAFLKHGLPAVAGHIDRALEAAGRGDE